MESVPSFISRRSGTFCILIYERQDFYERSERQKKESQQITKYENIFNLFQMKWNVFRKKRVEASLLSV